MTGMAVTSDERLRPDCSRCAALCCVAFAFERSADFAVDKAAGEPCPNLDACGGCRIYERRLDLGFGGCVQHDCHGAGQRVVQETFGGRSWLTEPDLLGPMSSAFATMWEVHKLLALLASTYLEAGPFYQPEYANQLATSACQQTSKKKFGRSRSKARSRDAKRPAMWSTPSRICCHSLSGAPRTCQSQI